MTMNPAKKDSKDTEAISAYPPELTQEMAPPPSEEWYSVFVQMEFQILAADGADATAQIAMDLGQGRSYKHYREETMAINARAKR